MAPMEPDARRSGGVDVGVEVEVEVDGEQGGVLLGAIHVGLALAPRDLNPGPLADAWNARIAAHRIARADVASGSVVRLGAARIVFLISI